MWRADEKSKTPKGKFGYDNLMLEFLKHYPELGRAYAKKLGYASEED